MKEREAVYHVMSRTGIKNSTYLTFKQLDVYIVIIYTPD